MLGIKGYNPKLYTDPLAILKDHKNSLKKVRGQKIKEVWVAWDCASNEWFNNCPVIISFIDCQIELCAYKTDEYIVTFNQVNLFDKLDWYGTELRLNWEKDKLEDLKFGINKEVKEIEILEWLEEDHFFLFGLGFQLGLFCCM